MFVPQWIIEKKRDGDALTPEDITAFIQGYHSGSVPDYQMAALAMAIYLKGMTFEETAALTEAMMHTGALLDTSRLSRPVCDKHSTGGIGDKVSLILAPLAAACGLAVPMISGRGLGITGGTLDKLESIPGYRTDLNETEFLQVVEAVGCSIIGQTATLAPADKKLYGLRDVTGTVSSIPLITASIMCKKMAEGLDALVLDVKVGRGAFMKTPEQARELARNMVRVGEAMGKSVGALLTNMDIPLGHMVGNALEVRESIECLQGKVKGPLWDVTRELTAAMLLLCGKAAERDDALENVQNALDSGRGLEIFRKMVEAQGGNPAVCEDLDLLPAAPKIETVSAEASGWIADVDADKIGRAVLVLGGGRTKAEDGIDHAVGLSELVTPGQRIEKGETLYVLHSRDSDRRGEALRLLEGAVTVSADAVEPPTLIFERMMPEG
jgi:pyrimidine-nucleoside phosphorylase